jgi:ParB family chromosome partitioning protein
MKKGLGKSLDEIISSGVKRPVAAPTGEPLKPPFSQEVQSPASLVRMIPVDRIQANPHQPRRQFGEDAIREMVSSIREHGILQPITVREQADGFYQIIAGERRWRAGQLAGLKEIPALIKITDDVGSLELALVENLQREDLNPLEEAYGYQQLATQFRLTQEEIAAKVGKDRATVANALRLLQLSTKLHQYLVHGQLTSGHAKSLLSIISEELQVRVAEAIIRDGLSVRATERLVRSLTSGRKKRGGGTATQPSAANMKALEETLQQRLGTRVRIVSKGDKGRIEIDYFTQEDLERLLSLLGVAS